MAYAGLIADIPLGQKGLRTDDPSTNLEPGHLLRAFNASLQAGKIEKDFGSRKWNLEALPGEVLAAFDWFPSPNTQRLIVVCSDGRMYRFVNPEEVVEVAASGTAPTTLSVNDYLHFVQGGEEESGNPRKLFLFSGQNPVQVITGDAVVRTNMQNPAFDWSGILQPFSGIIYRSRLWAIGADSRVYASSATDHEDFTTTSLQFQVFPGEGERLSGGIIYKGSFFLGKYPEGIYVLNDSDPSSTNWFYDKVNNSFGVATPFGMVEAYDDIIVANSFGSLTSIKAVQAFGDVAAADIFALLRVQEFVRSEIAVDEYMGRQGIFYQDKKLIMFSYQSASGTQNDRICILDMTNSQYPRVTWSDKDQANCLFLRKDSLGKKRPYYGSSDGFIYEMDQSDRLVGLTDTDENAYTFDVQTPWLDMAFADPAIGESNKNFDHLQVVYEPCGDWNLNVDVFIDDRFHRTITFNMGDGTELDTFRLDQDLIGEGPALSEKKDLGGNGVRISFRCYNSEAGQNVKIIKLRVYLRASGQLEKGKG